MPGSERKRKRSSSKDIPEKMSYHIRSMHRKGQKYIMRDRRTRFYEQRDLFFAGKLPYEELPKEIKKQVWVRQFHLAELAKQEAQENRNGEEDPLQHDNVHIGAQGERNGANLQNAEHHSLGDRLNGAHVQPSKDIQNAPSEHVDNPDVPGIADLVHNGRRDQFTVTHEPEEACSECSPQHDPVESLSAKPDNAHTFRTGETNGNFDKASEILLGKAPNHDLDPVVHANLTMVAGISDNDQDRTTNHLEAENIGPGDENDQVRTGIELNGPIVDGKADSGYMPLGDNLTGQNGLGQNVNHTEGRTVSAHPLDGDHDSAESGLKLDGSKNASKNVHPGRQVHEYVDATSEVTTETEMKEESLDDLQVHREVLRQEIISLEKEKRELLGDCLTLEEKEEEVKGLKEQLKNMTRERDDKDVYIRTWSDKLHSYFAKWTEVRVTPEEERLLMADD